MMRKLEGMRMEKEWEEIVDLHVHSTCSDGTMTPSELVKYACAKHLKAFALTDHDTVEGIEEAREAARGTPVEVIGGIEFSTVYLGKDVHIVGLDMDWRSAEFTAHLERFQNSRAERNEKIIRKMKENGFRISREAMWERFGDAIWTRAHFARYLMEQGYVADMAEAFERYLGEGRPYHIPREKITPEEVVSLTAGTGGIPVLAHPMQYRFMDSELQELIGRLKAAGLMGIEALYSTHTEQEEAYVKKLAERWGLEISGGSDFHGANKKNLDLAVGYGKLHIPYEVWERLKDRRERRNA